jgi:hypothetical protein
MARRMVTVEMAVDDLVRIATHGELGTGQLGDLMKAWAIRECGKQGLLEELKQSQNAKLLAIRENLKRVIGPELVSGIDAAVTAAAAKLSGTAKPS